MPDRQDNQHHLDAIVFGQILTGRKKAADLVALIEEQHRHIAELVALGRDTHRAEMLLSEMQRALQEVVSGQEPTTGTRQPRQPDERSRRYRVREPRDASSKRSPSIS